MNRKDFRPTDNYSKAESMTATEILNRAYKGNKNIMTPNVISIGKLDYHTAYELSTGRGMDNQEIFGVTIVKYDSKTGEYKPQYEQSRLFQNRKEAEEYISKMKYGYIYSKGVNAPKEHDRQEVEKLKGKKYAKKFIKAKYE
jgi:hypothetical protein